jgi:hypothetical protein
LEARVGIEPTNKGFAVLFPGVPSSSFHCSAKNPVRPIVRFLRGAAEGEMLRHTITVASVLVITAIFQALVDTAIGYPKLPRPVAVAHQFVTMMAGAIICILFANSPISTQHFINTVPAWRAWKRSLKRSSTGADENEVAARCGDLAVIITWRTIIETGSAVSRYHDFLVREVDRPKGAVLDLGKCRIGEQNKTEDVHLILRAHGTSSLVGRAGKPMFADHTLFLSWDGQRWFQAITFTLAPLELHPAMAQMRFDEVLQ